MTGSDSLGGIKLLTASKIDMNRLLYFAFSVFTIIVMFEPRYISNVVPSVHKIFLILAAVDAALIIIFAFIRKLKFNSMIIWFLALQILLFISTLINYSSGEVSVSHWFEGAFYPVMLLIFLKMISELDYRILVNSFSLVLGAYVFINFICWLLFPSGMYVDSIGQTENWFLGYDNVASVIILIAQMVSAYRYKSKIFSFKFWDIFVIVIGAVFIFTQKVATGIIAEAIFFVIIIFYNSKSLRKSVLKAKYVLIAFLLFFVFLQLTSFYEDGLFSFVLNFFKKNMSFYLRLQVWEIARKSIASGNFLFGIGIVDSQFYLRHYFRWCLHLHSYYLQVLYNGGIFSFIALTGFLFNSSNRFDNLKKSAISGIFLAAFAAILLMWLVEASGILIRYSIVVFFFLHYANIFDNSTVSERLKRGSKIRIVAGKSKKLA